MRIMDIGSRLRYEAIEAAAGRSGEPEDIQLPAAPELPVAPVCECKNEDCPWEAAVDTYTDETERAMTDYANAVDAAVSDADSSEEPDRDALEAAVSAWGEYVIREVFRRVRKQGTSWAVEVEARNALVGAGIGVARPAAAAHP
mgnify:CR=1 FL=1